MANSFLDLIGLAHFKEKQSQQISKEFAKKSEVVTKAEASDFAKHKTCSAIRDRSTSKPDYGLRKLFKNPCSQAELNKIVPFGFSLQRQKMVFFCH